MPGNKIYTRVYNVHGDDLVLSKIADVICVLMQRGVLICGFNDQNIPVSIHYNEYKKNLPLWILDFFEHQFINDPLLSDAEKVKAVFIGDNRNLIIPEKLYIEDEATDWLSKIHFIEQEDIVEEYPLTEENAYYLMACSTGMRELIKIYFKKAVWRPLADYQFQNNTGKKNENLHCCITPEQVFATLYHGGKLQWHQVFDYETAEDIAYYLLLLCKETGIDATTLAIEPVATSPVVSDTLDTLSQFFPGVTASNAKNNTVWEPVIYLLQQLHACAS